MDAGRLAARRDAFETNYTHGKYQFAFLLACHMLTMNFRYISTSGQYVLHPLVQLFEGAWGTAGSNEHRGFGFFEPALCIDIGRDF
jgi:hypothetical protein